MKYVPRLHEYLTLIYRVALAYGFYFIARLLFIFLNWEELASPSAKQIALMVRYGFTFDTTAILYVNLLFILLSLLPLWVNTSKKFQKIVFWAYFVPNILAYATNFIDMVYYPFSKGRLTTASFAVVENEQNKTELFFTFLAMYWYMFVLFVGLILLWVFLYNRLKIKPVSQPNKLLYFSSSAVIFVIFGLGVLAGIRGGDLSTATRPINMLDASRHVNNPAHADAILNTPFCLIRTLGKNKSFKEFHWVSEQYVEQHVAPIKQYHRQVQGKPNIIIFILESFGREYWGSMNRERQIADFKSYTPFLDSLATHGFIFDNAYANGRQSIHGMSSILAGIPTFAVAYTSSPYVKQPTQSIVSVCNEMGYDTSFFHSAPNGSMGFLGFSNILGFQHYYGKTEFNNDAFYDGIWGIWDEPFFQFMNQTLSQKQQPFMGTIFTVSSHHPFKIPEQYEGKFDKGNIPIHQCIGYTDFALRKFFESAQKEDWYANSLFVFVADHPNQTYYDLYKQPITNMGVPILFFSPNQRWVPQGISHDVAQQIDIYPTLADLMGYHHPLRSWGRSLFNPQQPPTAYVSSGQFYQMIKGNYIYQLDLEGNPRGVFQKDDEALKNNLLGKENNPEIEQSFTELKAFVQDYMHRIIHKKLNP